MEDLAWQFPAEAVERAAVRFCEAIARWRGKPELETVRPQAFSLKARTDCLRYPQYKSASWITGSRDQGQSSAAANGAGSAGTGAMSIESLVHSNPTSPTASTLPTPVSARQDATNRRRPAIEQYFTMPPSFTLHGRKRRREESDRGDEMRRAPMPPPAFG